MNRAVLFVILAASPGLMMGSSLTGTALFNGHGSQQVAVGFCSGSTTVQCIDFDWTGTTNAGPPLTVMTGTVDGTGTSAAFDITNAAAFDALNGGTATEFFADDLSSATDPTGAPLALMNFITFNNGSPWTVELTELIPGGAGTAGCSGATLNGQVCSPPGGPFTETNTCAGNTPSSCTVSIAFSFLGIANDGSGHLSSVIGSYTTTFSSTDLEAINADIAAGEDVVATDGGSVSFTALSTVPEMTTMSLMGFGLIGLGFLGRLKRRRS